VNAKDARTNRTPLHLAHSPEIAAVLIENGANVNLKNESGSTALMIAVSNGMLDFVKLLIKHGADVNALDVESNSSLHIACNTMIDNFEIVKMLIESGAKVNSRDKEGRTPLMIASLGDFCEGGECYPSNKRIIRLLLKYGADLNIKDNNNETALDYAKGQINIINLLKK
jgi:ankyrin repeat protein